MTIKQSFWGKFLVTGAAGTALLAAIGAWGPLARSQGAATSPALNHRPAIAPYKSRPVTSNQASVRAGLTAQFSGLQSSSGTAATTGQGSAASAAGAVALPVDLALPPAATFAATCAKCHGALGFKYPANTMRMANKKLVATVKGMMTRRARLSPTDAEILAMATYVRSLHGGVFVSITNGASFANGKDAKLRGEASDGAALVVLKDDQATTVTVTNGQWTLRGAPKAPFFLRVRNAGKTTQAIVTFPQAQWIARAAFSVTPQDRLVNNKRSRWF